MGVMEVALGVAIGVVLAWWAIRTLEHWSSLVHDPERPCWPTEPDQIDSLDAWAKLQAAFDPIHYPAPVCWVRRRLRRKWRRHCEMLKRLGWSNEDIIWGPHRRSEDQEEPRDDGREA